MSIKAMNWADDQTTGKTINKYVLEKLANYADENNSCFPSYQYLARKCESTPRTIIRAIKSLEEAGFIQIQPRYTKDGKQTSNRFILNIRGDKITGVGVTKTTPDPIRDNHINIHNSKGDKKDTPYSVHFEEWWKAYPRRAGSKKRAYDSWFKTVDGWIDHNELLSITRLFSQQQQGNELKFIPHPTTWLNGRSWETVKEVNKIQSNKNQLAG